MLQSKLFGTTSRGVPKDVVTTSHKLLYKGGFIRQISAGRYALLPLGFRVAEKVTKVIDDEMRRIGAQRIETPTLHPIEFWKVTNRDKAFAEEMLVVSDHHGATFAIGATAEGLMVELVKKFSPSYRDLPILIYQFVNKFRDEKRPRGGLLRVREFVMKDAYSFHESEQDLLAWYKTFYKSYLNIAKNLDIKAIPVLAYSGAIGGDYCHEFMVRADSGEDTIFTCTKCDYAANKEMTESIFKKYPQEKGLKPMKEVLGKGIIGVEALAKFLKIPVTLTTKTLLFQADSDVIAVCVRGDYDISETKLAKYLKCSSLKLASSQMVKKVTKAKIGYAGPLNLPGSVKVVWDKTTEGRINFEAGANKTNYHNININFDRDIPRPKEFLDVREVKEGETCVKCKIGNLKAERAIEFGHVFKQDHFYTGPMKGLFIDRNGAKKPMWMGAYGIGIGRAMAIIVETHNDEKGIIWPRQVAPFDAHILSLDENKKAENIYKELAKNNIGVLYDDRDVSAGEKFSDCDLIGIPVRLIVSKGTGNKIEWKERSEKHKKLLSLDEVVEVLK